MPITRIGQVLLDRDQSINGSGFMLGALRRGERLPAKPPSTLLVRSSVSPVPKL